MKGNVLHLVSLASIMICSLHGAGQERAGNPVIFADVPDMSIVRVGQDYYMSSTTMHMNPGVPIMKSSDLVNWKIISYAYDTLADNDMGNLANGKNDYGKGTWASSIRYHNGVFYVSSFSHNTKKTYIFSTTDPAKGPWKRQSFSPAYHDHSLFFDEDGKAYLIFGSGTIRIIELNEDLSDVRPGTEKVLIENAGAPAATSGGLPAEGSQLFRINGNYYLFNISWPQGGMRTVLVHRADNIMGPYLGRIGFQDQGIAQGGVVDTPDGKWFAYLFMDHGAVGRIPWLVPVKWADGWPVIGIDGRAMLQPGLPASQGPIPGIVASDEFSRKKNERPLPLAWQWNHKPDNRYWSVRQRKGYLRLTTSRTDTGLLNARNTLTQRTIGPVCSGSVSIDVTGMKDGDFAGLALLQERYGAIGVRVTNNKKELVMINAGTGSPVAVATIPLEQGTVHLRADCDFTDKKDEARFFYSLDGKTWQAFGTTLKMSYLLSHFMGYRFALFNYTVKQAGGYADFDYFRIMEGVPETLANGR